MSFLKDREERRLRSASVNAKEYSPTSGEKILTRKDEVGKVFEEKFGST
jgi:hypothetical protein